MAKIYKKLTKKCREDFKKAEDERKQKLRAFALKVEKYLEIITTDFEEEEAAERIMHSKECLNNILESCREGTPFRLAVRNELQNEVQKYEDNLYEEEREDFQTSYYVHNVW